MLFFFLLCMNIHAQTSMSEIELKRYLEENIFDIQPLEGIYFVKSSVKSFSTVETNTYIHAIVYSKQKHSYEELYYDKDTKMYKYLQKIQYDITSHIFRYISDNGNSIVSEYVVSNPAHFNLTNSDQFLYDNCEYTRLYPTEEMIATASVEKKVEEASNLIQNGFFSSALAILDDVMKNHRGPREYYYRASAYYGLKKFYAAIQDCNFALSYNNSEQNNYMIYYLRGLCRFLTDDKESGIADMKKAGEDGAKFLEEEGYTKTSARSQNVSKSNSKVPTAKRNNTPILKKTK